MASSEADFGASARRRSARKRVRRVARPSEAYLYRMPRLCISEQGNTKNRDVASSHNTLYEGSTRSGHTHHIAMHCLPWSLAHPRAPLQATNINATQRAPSRPSTHPPCSCLLTRLALEQLPKGLSGHAVLGAVPSRHGSHLPDEELRLVRLHNAIHTYELTLRHFWTHCLSTQRGKRSASTSS